MRLIAGSAAAVGPGRSRGFTLPPDLTGFGRRTRTGIASLAAVGLALAAHIIGEGMAPPLAALLPVVGAVWAVSHHLVQQRIRVWQWLALLGGAQLAVHVLSSLAAMPHDGMAGARPMLMLGAHIVSTVVTAAVLAFGDRVWWQILSWIYRIIIAALRPLPAMAVARWAITVHDAVVTARAHAGVLGMRAPPAAAAT